MTATQADILIEQGATFTLTHNVGGNYSAATASMKGRLSHAGSVVFNLSVGSGITAVHSGSTTTFTMTLSNTATAAISAPANGVYDFEVTLSGVTTRHLEGAWYITPESSR